MDRAHGEEHVRRCGHPDLLPRIDGRAVQVFLPGLIGHAS